MKKENRAYINNFESISCAGENSEELFVSICEKKESITLDSNYVKDRVVAIGKIKAKLTFQELLINKCKNVLNQSNLDNFENTLLVVGSSVGGMQNTEEIFFKEKSYKNINPSSHPINSIALILKENFNFYDDISFSTACTSSANALGYAKEVIQKGIYKNVLVVGIDSLSYTTVCGFSALSVLSSKPCTPFDKNREGMNVSEAIAVLLVQDCKSKDSIEICAAGYSSDAHHMTQPHPEGLGAKKAMENALFDAGITPQEIGYINAHGTGTQANDLAEVKAIDSVFNNFKPKISSTKSITGHTLGAAGALEAIVCCMVLKNQIIPPNKGLETIEYDNVNYSLEKKNSSINYAMSNSFAFGGNNTSLIFGLVK